MAGESKLTRFLKVKNVGRVKHSVGNMTFQPGEIKEVPDFQAKNLVLLASFEFATEEDLARHDGRIATPGMPPASIDRSQEVLAFAKEVRSAIWPDLPSEHWLREFNRDVSPCLTDEFDPIERAHRPFSVTFRLHGLTELNGGTRVILSICGYLLQRGHTVTISTPNCLLTATDLAPIPVRLSRGIEDADFVIGTFWPTINEVAEAAVSGRKVGFLQSDEPTWMKPEERSRPDAVRAFTQPRLSYISVSRHVAESCARNYGTHLAGDIGGNGVDGIDFSPRINDFNLRGTVCAIYRGVWFKNDLFPLQVMERVRQQRPDVKLAMAGFRRFSHAGVDTFLCNPTREEMALFYSGADFYLSGSKIEGSPLPPLEAMACGCIPVVTPVGTDEYLEPGKNGLAVDGDDPRTAAEAILRVYADDGLRRSLIREGLRTARHRTPQRTAHFFEKLLLKIGGER